MKEMKEITEKYRTIFGSPMGQEVLADILTMTHFGETLNGDNPHQIGQFNIGMAILAKMGVFSKETKMDVVRNLMATVPIEKIQKG